MNVRSATRAEANSFVLRHYLHRWPAIVTHILGLEHEGKLVGVCIFALPPRQTNVRYGISKSLELARLFVEDFMPFNTESWFIARAIRYVRQQAPDVELLVSYADPSANHIGTIYKASNWIADGRTDQERKTPRFDYMVDGKHYSRHAHVPKGAIITRVPRVSKFRFVYWLKPSTRNRL